MRNSLRQWPAAQPHRELSWRVSKLSQSLTMKSNEIAEGLKNQGKAIYNLTAGEPDAMVDENVKLEVIRSVLDNHSHYTLGRGLPRLRQLVAELSNRQQDLPNRQQGLNSSRNSTRPAWTSDHVTITNGGKQALYNSLMTLINPGDSVLIPKPYWVSYPEMVHLCEGESVFIEPSSDLKLTPLTLSRTLKATPNAKLLIFNSPNNPSGAVYTEEELKMLGEVIQNQAPHLWILSDEIYSGYCYEPSVFCSFLKACPDLAEQTVTVNGMSKNFAMTGWRVGWSLAPSEVSAAMGLLQNHCTANVNSLAQNAAIQALSQFPQGFIPNLTASMKERRDLCLPFLRKCSGLEYEVPTGAFYFFINCSAYFRKGENSDAFTDRVLRETGVALVSGSAFGLASHVRLAYCVAPQTLTAALEKWTQYLQGTDFVRSPIG